LAGTVAALARVTVALAAGYTLFGDAHIVSPGDNSPHAVQLRSTCPGGPTSCFSNNSFTCGGVDFKIPSGTTFSQWTQLSTDYEFTQASCGGGAPRFQLNTTDPLNSNKAVNIQVYVGPAPSYTGCPPNVWSNTGNLLSGVNPIDTSQLTGGAFYDPYTTAEAKFGHYVITGVQLVTDSGWFFPPNYVQTVLADNTNVNGTLYTYDQPQNKDECKDDGWKNLTDGQGQHFKNQGDCIQYANTGK
jgi:hypothetical protein